MDRESECESETAMTTWRIRCYLEDDLVPLKGSCIACDGPRFRLYEDVSDERYESTPGDEFDIVVCAHCGLLETDITGISLSDFYPSSEYRPHGADPANLSGIQSIYHRYLTSIDNALGLPEMADLVSEHLERGSRVLDVGTGTGRLIAELQDRGYLAEGCDVFAEAGAALREREIDIQIGTLDELGYEEGSFDAVVMEHSLEHVLRPNAYLSEIHQILTPSGLLFVEVPNAAGIEHTLFGRNWTELDAPRHVFNWTPEAIRELTRKHGFESQRKLFTASPRGLRNSLRNWIKSHAGLDTARVDIFDLPLAPILLACKSLSWTGRFQIVCRKRKSKSNEISNSN